MKVVLWILGIIGAIFLLLVIGGFFLGKSMSGSVEEGSAFAANATKQECVDEMAQQLRACDGVGCMVKTSGFVAGCLAEAKGEIRDVCGAVPSDSNSQEKSAWRGEFCSQHQLNEMACEMAVATLSSFCGATKEATR